MKVSSRLILLLSLLSLILLTGCARLETTDRVFDYQWKPLSRGASLGQSFVAEFNGMRAVEFLLGPLSNGSGNLILHLRTDPSSNLDVATATLPLADVTARNVYPFEFPALQNSSQQYYYSFLEIDGPGSVEVAFGEADKYLDGSAYQGGAPIEAQIKFILLYDCLNAYSGMGWEFLGWLGYLLIGLSIFTIPGWALLSFIWLGWRELSWWIKLPVSVGLSMAMYAILVLYTYLLHLQLGAWYVYIPVALGVMGLVIRNGPSITAIVKKERPVLPQGTGSVQNRRSFNLNLLLVIVLLLIAFTRYWAGRGIMVPFWNDSFHHTEITQLILDHHGLFSSWLPYAQYKSFSMHFGFSLSAALVAWTTQLNSAQAVVFTGQLMNFLAPLALYPVAVKLSRGNRIAGILAVLSAGLISSMPAYYVNWGRYAQLAAQAMLPIVLWLLWELIDSVKKTQLERQSALAWRILLLLAAMMAGMILFEYRMIFILIMLVLAVVVAEFIRDRHLSPRYWMQLLLSLGIAVVISMVVFLPWGLRIQHGNLPVYLASPLGFDRLLEIVKQDYQSWQNILFFVPLGLLIASLAAILLALIRKEWRVVSLVLWSAGMAGLYLMILVRLPLVQFVQSFAVLISLYMPISLLCAYSGSLFFEWMARWRWARIAIPIIILGLASFGVWNQRGVPHPYEYSIVRRPDLNAMQWIKAEIPADAQFLVEGMHVNWATNITGTDGGWWIPLLTQRQNNMPPQYAIADEQPVQADYSMRLIDLESQLEKTSLATQAGKQILCEYGITHVYIGQQQGMVGNSGKALFTSEELAASSVFHLIYQQDRVRIYSVEGACE